MTEGWTLNIRSVEDGNMFQRVHHLEFFTGVIIQNSCDLARAAGGIRFLKKAQEALQWTVKERGFSWEFARLAK